MSTPAYLDFKDALSGLAPPEAVKIDPSPVVVLATLNQLADQVFEPRAWLLWNDTDIQPQIFIQPVGGGGIVIENLRWNMPAGITEVIIQQNDDAAPIPTTGIDKIDIGGPGTRTVVGWRVGGNFNGVRVDTSGDDAHLPSPVFVAPGFVFRLGNRTGPAAPFNGEGVIREIPTTPMGF